MKQIPFFHDCADGGLYPPPAGGGLIEALGWTRSNRKSKPGIPRPRAGASLKPRMKHNGPAHLPRIPRPRAGASLKR